MSEKGTDYPQPETEVEELQQKSRHVRSELDELNEKMIQVTELKDENRLTTEFKESTEEFRKDFRNGQKILEKELSELRKQTQKNATQSDASTNLLDTAALPPQHIVHKKGPNEASDIPFETFNRSGRRVIASVTFGCTVTQFTVLPSKGFTTELPIIRMFWIPELVQTLPSKILLNQMKEIEEYGIEAKKKYDDLDSTQKREQYFYFESLKIKSVGLTENLKIEDVKGRSINAVDVYCAAIKYMKVCILKYTGSGHYKDLIEKWNRRARDIAKGGKLRIQDEPITVDDIFWVFTEPAVSDVNVKSCISEAARKAGIQNEHLAVIPLPIAALVYCKHIPDNSLRPLSVGNNISYSTVDAREQTVTISTYEVTDHSKFKELISPVEYTVKSNVDYKEAVTDIIGENAYDIVLVGQEGLFLPSKFPYPRIFVPWHYEKAVVVGAALCCKTPKTIKRHYSAVLFS